MPPAAHEASAPGCPRSINITSRTPRRRSARAIVNPITPPPMITTSAVSFGPNDMANDEWSVSVVSCQLLVEALC